MIITLSELGANAFNQKYLINHQNPDSYKEGKTLSMTDGRIWEEGGARWITANVEYFGNTYSEKVKNKQRSVRKNDDKVNMSYWLMFPNAAKELCTRMQANEDKYPNDQFHNYVPEETMVSLSRHQLDVMSPMGPIFDVTESKRDALTAMVFNTLCMLESAIVQEHEWAKESK